MVAPDNGLILRSRMLVDARKLKGDALQASTVSSNRVLERAAPGEGEERPGR
jgi:hypothetical protein